MSNPFVKATKTQAKLRLAIDGPSGSGKTYTALIAATVMANGGKIAVIDTERGSAALYSDKFTFDTATLDNYNPKNYIELIHTAEDAGYAVIVIDSLTHAWEGEGGALDMVDQAAARSQSKNSYFAWRDVTPLHRELVDAMLQSKAHIIATMRSKTEYVVEEVERGGRKTQVPRKIGLAPIQRQGMEYEFTIVGDMDLEHTLVITKSRCDFIADAVEKKPSAKFFKKIYEWLNDGAPTSKPETTKPDFVQAAKEAALEPSPAQATPNLNGMTELAKYASMTTPKGAVLGELDLEKLQVVVDKGAGELKKAAERLISKPTQAELDAYSALFQRAKKNGLEPVAVAPDAPAVALYQTYSALKGLIDEAEADIPEVFR